MQALARLVNSASLRVKSLLEKHGAPPEASLIGYIQRSIGPQFQSAIAGAPEEVTAAVTAAFADNGWDLGANEAAGSVSIEGLQSTLDTLSTAYPIEKRSWSSRAAIAQVRGAAVPGAGAGGGSGAGAGGAGGAEEVKAEDVVPPDSTPTADELEDISKACSRLWDLDEERLEFGEDYVIDLQRGKKPYHRGDSAPYPLFTHVDEDIWQVPVYNTFRYLLDNYTATTGESETTTRAERAEEWRFLRACMATPCMQYVFKYLVAKGRMDDDETKFLDRLHRIWFTLYRRDTRNDSSGFEHVFVGEQDEGKYDDDGDGKKDLVVKGMHNWVQLYLEEKKGALDYRGYIFPRRRGRRDDEPDDAEQVVTIQFAWNGNLKPVSTSFIGTSPAFELALYSLVFLLDSKTEEHTVRVGPYNVRVKSYDYCRGRCIGTAFPEAIE